MSMFNSKEEKPSPWTNCLRLERHELIKLLATPLTPILLQFERKDIVINSVESFGQTTNIAQTLLS